MKIQEFDYRDKDIFFISDQHFNHKNIINYCSRPFDNVQQMNEEMVFRFCDVLDLHFESRPGFLTRTEGLRTEGLRTEGLSSEGLSSEGLSSEGFSSEGFSSEGFSSEGFSSEGFSSETLSVDVWHVGDFSLSENMIDEIMPRLQVSSGFINHYLVMGNHDACHPCNKKNASALQHYSKYFKGIYEKVILMLPEPLGRTLVCHMPMINPGDRDARYPQYRPTPADMQDCKWLIHGHVHEKWKRRDNMINVGVDQWDFYPIHVEKLNSQLSGNYGIGSLDIDWTGKPSKQHL